MIRFVLSLIVLAAYAMFRAFYHPVVDVIQSQVAVGQLQDNNGLPAAIATSDLVLPVTILMLLTIVLIWTLPLILRKGRALLLLLVALSLSACGPYKTPIFVDIAPNETAFMVPLEGNSESGQAKFMSEDYLNQNKVASKRIEIPQRNVGTGYMPWSNKWIPTAQVIKVDRTPVVREWTKATDTGTDATNQAFKVESSESIDFWVGGVASSSIHEEDAAKFLYYFAGRPLKDVMDQNVRGMVQKILFDQFSTRTLAQGQKDKNQIFAEAEKEVKAQFASEGVTIDYIGGSEGMTYVDPKVQDAINANFEAQQAQTQAQAQLDAQDKLNQVTVSKAKAEADARVEEGRGEAEYLRQQGEQLAKYPQLVEKTLADKYQGGVPSTVVNNGQNGNASPVFIGTGITPPSNSNK